MPDFSGTDIGRYQIRERIGEGGMAVVYRAIDKNLNTDVAIKFIRTERIPPEQLDKALRHFNSEALNTAKLHHPNIVMVTDFGSFQGFPYLVMPYISGGTLKSRLLKPFPYKDAVKTIIPIVKAIKYANSSNVIHRDVKPANILISRSGEPMLTDFGIAKIFQVGDMKQFTTTVTQVGTPDYMAPEQWEGSPGLQTDQYALGIVLYEMLAGRAPFKADTVPALMYKHCYDALPRLKSFGVEVPNALERVLMKMLSKKPEQRYLDLDALLDDLDGVLVIKNTRNHTNVRRFELFIVLMLSAFFIISRVNIAVPGTTPDVLTTRDLTVTQPSDTEKVKLTPSPKINEFTANPTNATEASRSSRIPNGQIAYTARSDEGAGLFLLDLVTFESRMISLGKSENSFLGAALSPDGKKIAYYQYPDLMYKMDIDSAKEIALVGNCQSATWTQDSQEILCSSRDGTLLWSNGGIISGISARIASLSPVGNELVYTKSESTGTKIYYSTISGRTSVLIAGIASQNYAPTWSPAGDLIAYQSNDGTRESEIWVMNITGTNKERLTFSKSGKWSRSPTFSPDGQWIAYVSNQAESIGPDFGEIYITSLLNYETKKLTNTGVWYMIGE